MSSGIDRVPKMLVILSSPADPRGTGAARPLDTGATFDDLREAINTLEEIEPTARRVLGGAHPITTGIEQNLQDARVALRAREALSPRGA